MRAREAMGLLAAVGGAPTRRGCSPGHPYAAAATRDTIIRLLRVAVVVRQRVDVDVVVRALEVQFLALHV